MTHCGLSNLEAQTLMLNERVSYVVSTPEWPEQEVRLGDVQGYEMEIEAVVLTDVETGEEWLVSRERVYRGYDKAIAAATELAIEAHSCYILESNGGKVSHRGGQQK